MDSSGLKIPYEDLQKFLKMNDICITGNAEQEKVGMITRTELEKRLPSAFLIVQECMAKILKDNKVVDDQQFAEHDKKVLSVLSDSILKI